MVSREYSTSVIQLYHASYENSRKFQPFTGMERHQTDTFRFVSFISSLPFKLVEGFVHRWPCPCKGQIVQKSCKTLRQRLSQPIATNRTSEQKSRLGRHKLLIRKNSCENLKCTPVVRWNFCIFPPIYGDFPARTHT